MRNSQKGFIVPLLIVIIVVLVIGGGVYVYHQATFVPHLVANNQIVSTSTKNTNQTITSNSENGYIGVFSATFSGSALTVSFSTTIKHAGDESIDYGDGTSCSTANPDGSQNCNLYSHTYAKAGTYTAILYRHLPTTELARLTISVISSAQPSITVLSPNGGESYKGGDEMNIQWKSNIQGSHVVNIILQRTDETQTTIIANNVTEIVSPITGTSKYTWTVPSTLSGSFKVRVSSPDSRGQDNVDNKIADTSDSSFIISNSPAITVSGMQKYTDSSFGFSFWYPASWIVQDGVISDNYAGGNVQKTITISSSPNSNRSEAITINEFSSPTREITIAKDLCSPMSGLTVQAHRYYFDTNTHTWMVEVPAYTGQSEKDGSTYNVPASTKAADVSNNTMGGLHMLGAGCSGSVIPLSAKNFVVFSFNGRNVGPNYIELAKTITATDPSVATPASSEKQIQTITKAGVLLGAIGTKVGEWYVTGEHVYNWRGDVVVGANPSTFKLISTYSDGTVGTSYAADGTYIYSAWSAGAPVLSGANPSTFIAIRQQYQIPYAPSSGLYGQSFTAYDESFAKDNSHVWYEGKLIPNADPNTFVVTGNTLVQNSTGGYTLAHDARHTYGIDAKSNMTIDGVTVQQ